jgi:di/tricarboxylate transporter
MSWQAWVTLMVIVGVLALLVRGRTSPAFAVFGGTIALLATGVITVEQALSGFSNPAPITVAALYVVAAAVQRSGALTPLLSRTLGRQATGTRTPLTRLTVPAAAASGFLNNTPIVAMLIPEVQNWSARVRQSASKFLMPLSFAVVLGGLLTLIGTSTNLVVNGLMINAGMGGMGFFEIGKLGLPIAFAGLILMIGLAPVLLPARLSVQEELATATRRYLMEMRVEPGGPVDGLSVESAGLRHLQGVFLTSVDRGDTVIAPVRPDTVLRGGNVLRFAGDANSVRDLQTIPGLKSEEIEHLQALDDPAVRYYEAVIGSRSPLVGNNLKTAGFRGTYQAAVIAIHRDGELLSGKLGEVDLRMGDTLILVSDPGFRERWGDRDDFLLIAGMDGDPTRALPKATSRSFLAIAILATVVVLAATDLVPIVVGALVAAGAVVFLGLLTPAQARRSVDIEVIVVIAAAFGLAAAMESSGLAADIANGVTGAFGTWGDRGVLLGLVLATMVLTEMVTNNAAALLMFPIAIAVAAQTALNPFGVALAIAVAASASFLTPIGYQTNTMVYGPGGYRFTDYWRLGLPLTLLVAAMVVWLTPIIWP